MSRRLSARWLALLAFGLLFAACADVEPRVPDGEPLEVVRDAAERTTDGGVVEVFVSRPDGSLEGEVDLARGSGPPDVREQAAAALERLAQATEAVPYGGQQVRGAATMRYEVTTAGAEIDVWVDGSGRARRVQMPDGEPGQSPPPTQENGVPALVTVDFVFATA